MTRQTEFRNAVALVTGAASGIGAACARWLDEAGIGRLILIDPDLAGLQALDLACETDLIEGSVADESLWHRLDESHPEIDFAVVNAGVGGSGVIAAHGLESWRRVMSVNLDGAFLTLSYAMRAMKRRGSGSVVVTASATGIKAVPGIGAYGVAKAGVCHMTRIAALEGAPDRIRVNAVAPGGVDTALWDGSPDFRKSVEANGREATIKAMSRDTPRGTFATPEELAGQIGFLLSGAAANITGEILVTDGGYSL